MIGEILGDRYRIQDRIGEGGMAFVYLAYDEKLGRKVAVKVLHAQFEQNEDIRSRFDQEARAISSLDHPNIVKIYDFSGENSRQLWIVTEMIEGENLAQYVRKFPDITLHPIIASCIVREICKALEQAHAKGIIHRDVKPENIMLTRDGHIKLMDFGIAKDTGKRNMTQTGTFMGSPSYMSPEQIRGKEIDHRTDIYSLAVLYYEVVTGHLPFKGQTAHEVVMKIAEGQFIEPAEVVPTLPSTLNAIISRNLAKNPNKRMADIIIFGREIDNFLSAHGYVESHVELERYFTDRIAYEARLNKAPYGKTASHKPAPQPAQSMPAHEKQADSGLGTTIKSPRLYAKDPDKRKATRARKSGSRNLPRPNQHNTTLKTPPPPPPPPSNLRGSQRIRTPENAAVTVELNRPLRKHKTISKKPRPNRAHRTPARNATSLYRQNKVSLPLRLIGVFGVGLVVIAILVGFWLMVQRLETQSINEGPDLAQNTTPVDKPSPPKVPNFTQTPAARPSEPVPEAVVEVTEPEIVEKPATVEPTPSPQPKPKPPVRPRPKPIQITKPKEPAPSARPSNGEHAPERSISSHQLGRLSISSTPAAQIYIDGKQYGTTIDQVTHSGWINLRSGNHILELRRKGHKRLKRRVRIPPGGEIKLEGLKLSRADNYPLTIVVNPLPARATVRNLANGRLLNYRIDSSPKTIDLPRGRYEVKLEFRGDTRRREIELPGRLRNLIYSVNFAGSAD